MKKTIIVMALMMLLVGCIQPERSKTTDKTTEVKTEISSQEEKGALPPATIQKEKNSYSLSMEDTYQLEFEVLNAQEVHVDAEEAKKVLDNEMFRFQIYPYYEKAGNNTNHFVVYADEERYYVVNLSKTHEVVYVLHPYNSPIIKGILEKK